MTDYSSFTNALAAAMAERVQHTSTPTEQTIRIEGALRALTALYERMRTLIDYQEERFIRRLAIRRILIRRIIILRERTNIGEPLLLELVRAAYLENGKVPVSAAVGVDHVLAKYLATLPVLEERYRPPELLRMQRTILGVAAAEIEDLLNPAGVEYALTARLTQDIAEALSLDVAEPAHIVALRAFVNADTELVAWRLLREPGNQVWYNFATNPTEQVGELVRELRRIEHTLNHRLVEPRVRQVQRLIPPYLVLADLAYHHPTETVEVIHDPVRLRNLIDGEIRKRLAQTEQRIQRSMVRATFYILLSKLVLGLPIEVAFDLATHGHVSVFPLVVNTLIPPSLMLTAALSLRPPSPENSRVLADRSLMLAEGKALPPLEGMERRRTSTDLNTLFTAFFLATYLVVFGAILWLLYTLQFNIVSAIVFFFFVSVVGFFAFRLRAASKELLVLEEKDSAFLAAFDFFALPFLRLGRALSITARNFNVFLFFLDFIVEAPLKIVFVVIEDWFAFLREKREELR